ncbi:MAG: hypothetical protein D6753_18130 [Planctomycetota bacterium]|nr:MAG: hypothetical protein D6753_18130 [Planctomycetota bacterium]
MHSGNQPTSRLAPQVVEKLRRVRSLLRRYVAAQAVSLAVIWCIVFFWGSGLLDYLPVRLGASETPTGVRIVLLGILLGGAAWILIRWAGPRLWIRMPDSSIALLIEKHYPHLENELVTAVELDGSDDPGELASRVSNPTAYLAMLQRVRQDLAQRMERVDPWELFNWQPVWGLAVGAVFAGLFSGLLALGNPGWVQVWSQRLFALSDQPWPRRAELRPVGVQLQLPPFTGQLSADRIVLPFTTSSVRVPTGASLELHVEANAAEKQVPEVCTLYYRSEDGVRGRANLRRVGRPRSGWQPFVLDGPPLESLSSSMTLDVVGLDARLRNLRLETVEPAVIMDMQVQIEYPRYLLQSLQRPPVESVPYRSGMQIPEGATVALQGQASGPLREVQYVIHLADEDLSSGVSDIHSVAPEGRSFRIPLGRMDGSAVMEIRLIDADGLSAAPIPRYVLSVPPDTVPEVDTRLVGIGSAITPVAVLPIEGTIADDHGLARVAVELATETTTAVVPVDPPADGRLQVSIDLQELAEANQVELEPGQSISLVVAAEDFYDLNDQHHIGRGQPKQLAVVTPDELLVQLDREELQLRQRLEQIIVELEQLRGALERIAQWNATARRLGTAGPGRVAIRPMPWVAALLPISLPAWPQAGEDADPDAPDAEQQRRIMAVRAQQSVLQGDKSHQELMGILVGVDNIRLQLIHNRIDSKDRQARLLDRVYEPLKELLNEEFVDLRDSLGEMQSAAMSDDPAPAAIRALRSLDAVLAGLQQIKQNMLDIESFNEIIDLVRGLLEDQEKLLEQTEKAQKAKILDILK